MFVVQKFYNQAWCDVFASHDAEEAREALRRYSVSEPEEAYKLRNLPDPTPSARYATPEGALIVQVEFEPGGHRYAYACPTGETFRIGDRVSVPANWVSPDGGKAVIVGVGTDYGGELSVIKEKLE